MAGDAPGARVAADTEVALRLLAGVRHSSRDLAALAASEAFVDRYLGAIGASEDAGGLSGSASRLARGILRVACEPGQGMFEQLLSAARGSRR